MRSNYMKPVLRVQLFELIHFTTHITKYDSHTEQCKMQCSYLRWLAPVTALPRSMILKFRRCLCLLLTSADATSHNTRCVYIIGVFCSSWSLYGYSCSHFRRIFLTVGSGIFNSRLALRTDSLGLRVNVSRTLSTVSSLTLGLHARPFPWWQMHPL
jgi:hypothetical protein